MSQCGHSSTKLCVVSFLFCFVRFMRICLHVYLCTTCVSGSLRGQKEGWWSSPEIRVTENCEPCPAGNRSSVWAVTTLHWWAIAPASWWRFDSNRTKEVINRGTFHVYWWGSQITRLQPRGGWGDLSYRPSDASLKAISPLVDWKLEGCSCILNDL